MPASHLVLAAVALLGMSKSSKGNAITNSNCRCMPGDLCWPAADAWNNLNTTVEGRLVSTVPLGSPCHDPMYDAQACSELQAVWPRAETNFPSPYSVWPPLFQGNFCLPYTPQSSPCTIGKNIRYAINVSSTSDIAAGLHFAQDHNLRLAIKNTGHDLLGKSAGAGGLGLWTHYLKDISTLNYSTSFYSGPAVKVGTGVQAWEVIKAAAAHGLKVLGGSCAGVGVAGGFAQGGGHSPLSSWYGLAADNVLEWEVVTAGGKVVTASPNENSDLYWGLSGGGGSTFGVVHSMTMRAWPDGSVAGASVTLTPTSSTSDKDFTSAIRSFHTHLSSWTSAGATTAHLVGQKSFQLYSLTWPDHTEAEARKLLSGWQSDLDALKIPYNMSITASSTYLEHYTRYFGPLPYDFPWLSQVQGGRLVPTATIDGNLDALMSAIHNITESGVFQVLGNGMNVSQTSTAVSSNAVLPAWRVSAYSLMALHTLNFSASWSDNLAAQDQITNSIDPLLHDVMPDSGSYLSEANPYLKTWKEDFYGNNYDRLKAVKKTWDPDSLFYARTAVGSDEWTESPTDGRLCRT